MHYYGPWVQQPVLDNHWYYDPPYVDQVYSFRQRMTERVELESSQQTLDETHDTITSATSSELFRLEFAAAHWSKLVSNAEGLFNKLMTDNLLPHSEQDQIEQWLCMKQEYEECITSDDNTSLQGFPENSRRSLERIEEEADESFQNVESENCSENCSNMDSEFSEEEQSETDTENPDFLERLDDCIAKFKKDTDKLVEEAKEFKIEEKFNRVPSVPNFTNNNNDFAPIIKPIPIRNGNFRRNSIFPGSEMCNEVRAFGDSLKNCTNQNYQLDVFDKFQSDIELQHITEKDNASRAIRSGYQGNSSDLHETLKNPDYLEPAKALRAFRIIQNDSDNENPKSESQQKPPKPGLISEKLPGKKNPEDEKKKKQSKKEERKRLKESRKASKQLEKMEKDMSKLDVKNSKSRSIEKDNKERRLIKFERSPEEKRELHVEIHNLRHTREKLINEKCCLTEKLKLDFKLSKEEMRKLVEIGETIEAIDEVIQRKNEMILGRQDFFEYEEQREKNTQKLMEQLAKLTEGEIRALFYKYFLKVIDVKESAKEREQEIRDLEVMYNKRVHDLQLAMQKKLKEIMHCAYWPVTKEGNEMELKLVKYKKENRQLKHQLANVKALLTGSVVPRTTSPPKLRNNATTTVTVQKNKMVILRKMNPNGGNQVEK